ncbi:MAG: hypothetical protein R6V85_14465 [Polyangia bacterium]
MRVHRAMMVPLLALSVAAASPAAAQRAGGGQQREAAAEHDARKRAPGLKNELMEHLYPIEMVRAHADQLELSGEQIRKLRKVVTDVRIELENLRWDVARESQRLARLVAEGASKERVYAQMDRIFEYENKMKKKQLGLLIVIRDVLTTQQRAVLDEIKERHRASGVLPPPPGAGGPPRMGGPPGGSPPRQAPPPRGRRPGHSAPPF